MNKDRLIKHCDELFRKKQGVNSLWQAIADNFYPERADFTEINNVGREFGDHLVDSFPVRARRDLANLAGSMLRSENWFELVAEAELDHAGKSYLEWLTKRQASLMKFQGTGFMRAAKEADHDFFTFGQAVMSAEYSMKYDSLLYRTWHLRDCAWSEDERGQVCTVVRKWKPTIRQLADTFGRDALHARMVELLDKDPEQEVPCQHIVMPVGHFDSDDQNPYISTFIDTANNHILEQKGITNKFYIVPRFATLAGSQYAYSPATMASLPDARTLQAMAHTLIEAGELFVRPPLLATQNALRSDVNVYAGGVTWVDEKYDERLGEVLRPLGLDRGGLPLGFQMHQDLQTSIAEGFYLNKLTLPNTAGMTAYEVSERMAEFQRQALPLFSPMEEEYNGQLCEITFDLLTVNNKFGSAYDVPDSLKGIDLDFKFSSPISEASEKIKGQLFVQAVEFTTMAGQVDPQAIGNFNADIGLRDAIIGSGGNASWLRTEEDVMVARQQQAMQQQAQQMAEMAAAGGDIETAA